MSWFSEATQICHDCLRPHKYVMIVWGHTNMSWWSEASQTIIHICHDGLRPHKISHDCLRPHTYVMIVWGHTKYISCSLNLFALKISSAYRKFCKTAFLCAFSKCSFPCYFLLLYDFSNKRIMGCSEEIK